MIQFEHVDKVYEGGLKALDDINLDIPNGRFVAIVGKSGAGKSTLIRTINKMHDINGGKLTVNDMDVSALEGSQLRKFRRNIGMVFQSFNLVEKTTVLNNVLTAFLPDLAWYQKVFSLYTEEQKVKALEALESVDILDKAYDRVDQLSGGQKQRVALARTLVQEPSIILADEPVASLDPISSKQVMDYFKTINQSQDITILINIHDVDMALDYADSVIGINSGKIVYYGPSSEVTQEILDTIYKKS
ncbi:MULTISPECIES: phosphonate ABC transporter ATP-binding protein [Aerococcus]|uniref:phosphonate ABC transporter ATP-binding protein n=1 Tax=Aerococcus urinae (strain CCUG 59500 / ACS-120-V-Col10a) TaxID=2976812 RepID=UPI000200F3EC|nr:phosphonate ABC transporter ATP-binding protein [Aerococcus sp. Group 1]AEA01143.1 phosphonate ABC transporter, ATP-binding protein [Aerococcus sp. Group 1]MCY3030320.1 phosphonate ABC transporter ATP-binding protein [Aerococcus sp. Group 1]MCY3055417.1 phosphonate ABC transporter ATP-binding protein [Aerococcus sp. Group 1]MCY3057147.1 phosphonate ABC transporter ATP-binding protein [Aerococcus sp. Group 1]MCY3061509.1 phosphonate ABC transporter ATP-binding protein [Aerococcus sp. Group 1